MSHWLRKQTNFSGGLSAGGGDTTWDATPQVTLLTKKVSGTTAVTATLPKGTTILDVVVLPDVDNPPAAGTVTVANTTAATNLAAGTSATASSRTALSPAVRLTVDSLITITPSSLTAGTAVHVGLTVIAPAIRP